MSQKAEKPSLSGTRIKTRKRDEKEKYDPLAFRDAVLQGLAEAGDSLDAVSKFLDTAGNKLNYRRYAEPLFDVLFAGGILAPGGSLLQDADPSKPYCTEVCVFRAEESMDAIKAHYGIFYKLIRRYKYLEKSFEEELKKLILFLKGFGEAERRKLAMITGICLACGLGNPGCLQPLFEEHLVKEGLSIDFATVLFKAWLGEKDMASVATSLKRSGMEGKLLNLLPINKRTQENFEVYFSEEGLHPIVEYQRVKANTEVKKELYKKLEDMFMDEESVKDMITVSKDHLEKTGMQEYEVCVMAWTSIMTAVEWNKKEELVADQALKHLRIYAPLLGALSTSGRSQLTLMVKLQEYCYDNMNFFKVFQKIVVLLYKMDVVGEDCILKWYRDGHSTKGKSVFLDQMKKFVEWLENAEEESEEED